jgi:hypothetical protein
MFPRTPRLVQPVKFQPYAPQIVSARGVPRPAHSSPREDFSAFMALARKRFRIAAEAENRIRQESLEDLKFYAGDQWPATIQSDRVLQNRPCLTINRLPQFAKQIINEQRASRPSIQVNPVGDGADVDTAEVIQGLTRHIEINSNAEVAYDTAFEHAVIHGFGYFRVLTDFIDGTFDQEVLIKPIRDPFTVYFDPFTKEPDYSDAQYCFICEDIPRDSYREMYPDSEVASLSDFKSLGDGEREWFEGGNVRVAEYFYVRKRKKTIVQLADGRVMDNKELKAHFDAGGDPVVLRHKNGDPMVREIEVPEVRWCKMNAREILDETDWAGKWIPIIPVLGDELIVDGKRKLYGIVRHAKDAQRQYNYMRTGVVEQIALSTKAPWLVMDGQIEGYEEWWKQANTRNFAYLPYKGKTVGKDMAPPPIRNQWEPPIQAYTAGLAQSDNDLKATTGIYDASLGAPGPEQSGKAILARQKEGEQANANLMDNLSRSIRHAGRVILDLIPKVYDTPRVIRIVNPDQTHKMVPINGAAPPQRPGIGPDTPQVMQTIQKLYDVTVGRYDVTISVGPSYQSKRQEFVQSVLSLVEAAPQTMAFVMDLLVRNMDWPGANEIADRLKKMLPPQLQDTAEGQPGIPPQAQAQIAALLQERAQLAAQLQAATNTIETKRLEFESRERIAGLQAKVDIIVAELKAGSSRADTLAQLEYSAADKQLELWHKTRELDQQSQQADANRQHQAGLQQSDQAHQAQMAEQQAQNQAQPQQ